jgi:hypothetical protein
MREDWTASALPITGHRRAKTCNFEIVPPHGEACGRVAVDRARSVAGDARFKKGQTPLDWRKTASITAGCSRESNRQSSVMYYGSEKVGWTDCRMWCC